MGLPVDIKNNIAAALLLYGVYNFFSLVESTHSVLKYEKSAILGSLKMVCYKKAGINKAFIKENFSRTTEAKQISIALFFHFRALRFVVLLYKYR